MVNFKENIVFQGSGGGTHFPRCEGGVSDFFQGGGVHCLFPIETHITCDFLGGVRTPCHPSGSALGCDLILYLVSQCAK